MKKRGAEGDLSCIVIEQDHVSKTAITLKIVGVDLPRCSLQEHNHDDQAVVREQDVLLNSFSMIRIVTGLKLTTR